MADNTKIEWTDATWNPITGCSIVSPGCTNCYAMKLAGTRLKNHESRSGLTKDSKAGPVWTGEVRFNEQWLDQPLRWKKPRMIFVCAHGDLFAEGVPDEWIDLIFAVMALCPQHTFQVLTKRPGRMRAYLRGDPDTLRDRWFKSVPVGKWPVSVSEAYAAIHPHSSEEMRNLYHKAAPEWPLPNVWLGVSVEDQTRADERIPILLDIPASIRWISAEPLLGPVDLGCVPWPESWPRPTDDISDGIDPLRYPRARLDWVVAGGESGPGARPAHPDWFRALRDQCAAADVPFLFKQWGNWLVLLDRDREDPDWRASYSREFSDANPDISWLNLAGGSGFHGDRFHIMQRVSKSSAGRLLDGVEHNGFPEVRT